MIKEIDFIGIKINVRDDYPTDEVVIKEMFEENVYELHSWHFDDPDGVVVDIGANIGAFSLQAASIGARKIYSIEPEPKNFAELESNVKLNNFKDKIFTFQLGIGNFIGKAIISDEGGDSTFKDGKPGTEVDILTLDKFFEDNQIENVNVLKIDVEGAEPEVILSASKANLNKCKYIAIEFDIRSGDKLGLVVMKLSETHHVRTMGSWNNGGMIFANRY